MTAALIAFVGCGGGDDGASGDDDGTTGPTTTEPTTTEPTTTAVSRDEADQATQDLANAGVLQPADFPEGWTQYDEGERWIPDDGSCAAVDGGGPEDTLLEGSVMKGPSTQLRDEPGFVTSRAYVFPTEADAIAWVDIARGDAWAECERTRLEEAYYPDGGAELRIETRENENLGQSGFDAYLELVGQNDDGQFSAATTLNIHRIGRTVIRVGIEDGGTGDDAQLLYDGEFDARTAAIERVSALS